MKILFVTHHWLSNTHHSKYSGYQYIAKEASKNHDVEVITIGDCNNSIYVGNIKVHYVKSPKRDFFFLKRFIFSYKAKKLSKKLNYDIIHILYTDCGYFFTKKDKYINTLHLSPSVKQSKSFVDKWYLLLRFQIIDKKVIKNSKLTITVSTNLLNCAKKYSNNVTYIPHGVATYFWKEKESGVSNDPNKNYAKTLLTVGSHGIDTILLNEIINLNSSFLFIIVGINPTKFKILPKNAIIKNSISDEELLNLYHTCDLFLRPIDFATANNSILEAMSTGIPIVTANIEGVTDYLDQKSAYLASSKDEYNDLITEAFVNSEKTKHKSNNAKKYITQKFSWEKIFIEIEKNYKKLI